LNDETAPNDCFSNIFETDVMTSLTLGKHGKSIRDWEIINECGRRIALACGDKQ